MVAAAELTHLAGLLVCESDYRLAVRDLLVLLGFVQHTEALLLDALLRQHRIGTDVERLAQLADS